MAAMKRALAITGLAILTATAAASAGWAKSIDLSVADRGVFQQRKDVDEVSRPLPPSGPITPSPFCNPASVLC